jgi:PAT family beta-lactamase induction signal transducer AmpG
MSAPAAWAPFGDRASTWRIVSIGLLGFASGLPLALSGSALQAWFTTAGMDLRTIGWMTLVGQAYVFKFLWAPLIDRFAPPWFGRRRGWILIAQATCAAALVGMSLYEPGDAAATIAFLAVVLAFASATQDIAYDAHRTDLLLPAERGWGTAFSQGGYRLAMLTSGALGLILADVIGWAATYRAMAVLMLVMIVVAWRSPEGPDVVAPRRFADSVVLPFVDFFRRHGLLVALGWLALMVLYKLGDAFGQTLATAFLLREVGFSLSEVGAINKAFGLASGLAGALVGGWALTRMRLVPALLWFGVFQAVTNLGYVLLIHVGPQREALALVVIAENFAGGLGSTAFVVLLTALCNVRFSATQYALLSSLAAIGRVFLGPIAAVLIEHIGWADFFVVTAVSALPGLLLVIAQRERIRAVEGIRVIA